MDVYVGSVGFSVPRPSQIWSCTPNKFRANSENNYDSEPERFVSVSEQEVYLIFNIFKKMINFYFNLRQILL